MDSSINRSIQEGFKQLQLGDPEAAISYLTPVTNFFPVTNEVIEAMRLAGVAFRRLQYFEASTRYLEDSIREARRLKKPDLEALATEELLTTSRARATHR